ncbi:unnamed protein product [Protopolystoma xenopodis]|uniref:Uncharacterized protein n=1 Tax=Protopolystoma xenopodis TaxID=117903 RepID=A0A448WAV8_9PLAT|nr:unnamed protein product [Protopolystoma xenopodis]
MLSIKSASTPVQVLLVNQDDGGGDRSRIGGPSLLKVNSSHLSGREPSILGTSAVNQPLLSLNPPPNDDDYHCNLGESEGLLQPNLCPSLFLPPNSGQLHLDRCRRVLPQNQNTCGFFISVLVKIRHLPWMNATKGKKSVDDQCFIKSVNVNGRTEEKSVEEPEEKDRDVDQDADCIRFVNTGVRLFTVTEELPPLTKCHPSCRYV